MKKTLPLFLFISLLFSCQKTTSEIKFVNDLVTGNLVFEVYHVPCEDRNNEACNPQPLFDATVRIYRNQEGSNERQFVGEDKTNHEGKLSFNFVPLGNYEVEVSTNEFGDQNTTAESVVGIISVIKVWF